LPERIKKPTSNRALQLYVVAIWTFLWSRWHIGNFVWHDLILTLLKNVTLTTADIVINVWQIIGHKTVFQLRGLPNITNKLL